MVILRLTEHILYHRIKAIFPSILSELFYFIAHDHLSKKVQQHKERKSIEKIEQFALITRTFAPLFDVSGSRSELSAPGVMCDTLCHEHT